MPVVVRRSEEVDRRFERLRALFRQLAVAWPLVGLPGALTGAACYGPCLPPERVFLIRQPDETTRALLEACEDPTRQDCLPLCEYLTRADGGVSQIGGRIIHCEVDPSTSEYTEVRVQWEAYCPGGRRPEGLVLGAAAATGAGELFARIAQLEAASVPAFARLARELHAHGAPASLIAEAASAVSDERRHAHVIAALARRFGASSPRPVVPELGVRTLESVAGENATEGCVREAYGALVATHQALRAADPLVRRAMAAIAVDETRHAALSYAIDGWARRRLGAAAGRRVAEARREAQASLARDVERPVPVGTASLAGLPDAASARRLAEIVGRLGAELA